MNVFIVDGQRLGKSFLSKRFGSGIEILTSGGVAGTTKGDGRMRRGKDQKEKESKYPQG